MKSTAANARRVAIVTGAGKGIGRACAIELARVGMAVIVNNRSHASDEIRSADSVVEEIIASGGQAVANYQSIESSGAGLNMLEQALDEFGQLDVVISNAGISLNRTTENTSQSELRDVMELNFFAAAALSQAVLPALRDSGSGRLVHSISSAGLYSGFGQSAYAASKAALWAYLKACALEYKKFGVCVNSVAPFADTQMTAGFISEELQQQLTPGSVAPLFAWLASTGCDINGETLIAAGGLVRAAKVGETSSECFSNHLQAGAASKKVLQQPFSRHFISGNEAFADICADLSG